MSTPPPDEGLEPMQDSQSLPKKSAENIPDQDVLLGHDGGRAEISDLMHVVPPTTLPMPVTFAKAPK
eukprot:813930-Rhodomonas_salina.2